MQLPIKHIFPSGLTKENCHPLQQDDFSPISCSGYCISCKRNHTLSMGAAKQYCLQLMNLFEEKKRIDLTVTDDEADPHFSTEYLFGKARGQMFGVMVFKDKDGIGGALPAFSGQFDGTWHVAGWVPPLFDVDLFYSTTFEDEKEIKRLSHEMKKFQKGSPEQRQMTWTRKAISRELMKEIHGLYSLKNFHGKNASIYEAFTDPRGIPTGTGDCCAPKLLHYAATNQLTPLGIAEFYWGKENRSKTRQHGSFYTSCQEKCAPILGFLLCGLSNSNKS